MKNIFLLGIVFIGSMGLFGGVLATQDPVDPIEQKIHEFNRLFDAAYHTITAVSRTADLTQGQIGTAREQLGQAQELLDTISGLILFTDNPVKLALMLRVGGLESNNNVAANNNVSEGQITRLIQTRLNDLRTDIDLLNQILDGYEASILNNQGTIEREEAVLAPNPVPVIDVPVEEAVGLQAVAPQEAEAAPLIVPQEIAVDQIVAPRSVVQEPHHESLTVTSSWWQRAALIAGSVFLGVAALVEVVNFAKKFTENDPEDVRAQLGQQFYGFRTAKPAKSRFWPF